MRDILTAGLTALGLDTAAAPQLERYAALLLEKNKVMNLTAITDAPGRGHPAPAGLRRAAGAGGHARQDASSTWAPARASPAWCWPYWSRRRGSRCWTVWASGWTSCGRSATQLGLKNVTCVHARAEEFAAGHRERFDIADIPRRGAAERAQRADAAAGEGGRPVRRHEVHVHRRGDCRRPQRHRPAGRAAGRLHGLYRCRRRT